MLSIRYRGLLSFCTSSIKIASRIIIYSLQAAISSALQTTMNLTTNSAFNYKNSIKESSSFSSTTVTSRRASLRYTPLRTTREFRGSYSEYATTFSESKITSASDSDGTTGASSDGGSKFGISEIIAVVGAIVGCMAIASAATIIIRRACIRIRRATENAPAPVVAVVREANEIAEILVNVTNRAEGATANLPLDQNYTSLIASGMTSASNMQSDPNSSSSVNRTARALDVALSNISNSSEINNYDRFITEMYLANYKIIREKINQCARGETIAINQAQAKTISIYGMMQPTHGESTANLSVNKIANQISGNQCTDYLQSLLEVAKNENINEAQAMEILDKLLKVAIPLTRTYQNASPVYRAFSVIKRPINSIKSKFKTRAADNPTSSSGTVNAAFTGFGNKSDHCSSPDAKREISTADVTKLVMSKESCNSNDLVIKLVDFPKVKTWMMREMSQSVPDLEKLYKQERENSQSTLNRAHSADLLTDTPDITDQAVVSLRTHKTTNPREPVLSIGPSSEIYPSFQKTIDEISKAQKDKEGGFYPKTTQGKKPYPKETEQRDGYYPITGLRPLDSNSAAHFDATKIAMRPKKGPEPHKKTIQDKKPNSKEVEQHSGYYPALGLKPLDLNSAIPSEKNLDLGYSNNLESFAFPQPPNFLLSQLPTYQESPKYRIDYSNKNFEVNSGYTNASNNQASTATEASPRRGREHIESVHYEDMLNELTKQIDRDTVKFKKPTVSASNGNHAKAQSNMKKPDSYQNANEVEVGRSSTAVINQDIHNKAADSTVSTSNQFGTLGAALYKALNKKQRTLGIDTISEENESETSHSLPKNTLDKSTPHSNMAIERL